MIQCPRDCDISATMIHLQVVERHGRDSGVKEQKKKHVRVNRENGE